jgi:hypothetical protein
MPFPTLSPEDVIAAGTRIIRTSLEGGKIVVAYGKPALDEFANLTSEGRYTL